MDAKDFLNFFEKEAWKTHIIEYLPYFTDVTISDHEDSVLSVVTIHSSALGQPWFIPVVLVDNRECCLRAQKSSDLDNKSYDSSSQEAYHSIIEVECDTLE